MTAGRLLITSLAVVTAVLLQTTLMATLPLPGAAPDLVVVLVIGFALVEGPMSGLVTGFAGGLLADLPADHQLGRLALAYGLVGYVCGQVQDDTERSTVLPFAVVTLGAVLSLLVFCGEGLLLGDPRVSWGAVARGLASSVPYDVVLTPFVVPFVGALVRRSNPGAVRG